MVLQQKSHTMSCYCIELNPIQQERWGSIPVFSEGGWRGGSVSLAWDRGTTSIEWESGESGKNTNPDFVKPLFWIFDGSKFQSIWQKRKKYVGYLAHKYLSACGINIQETNDCLNLKPIFWLCWGRQYHQCDVRVIEQNVISRLDKICGIFGRKTIWWICCHNNIIWSRPGTNS